MDKMNKKISTRLVRVQNNFVDKNNHTFEKDKPNSNLYKKNLSELKTSRIYF
jgi:hypothetical protein